MNEEQHNFGDNKKSGFGMPEGYFNSFDSRLMKKIEMQEELSEFPTLSSINKVNPFFVDPSYFDELPSVIAERIQSNKSSLNWFEKIKIILLRPAFAFSFLIALILTALFTYKSQTVLNEEVCTDLACLSKEEILNSKDFSSLTVDELMEEMPDNSFTLAGDSISNDDLINDLIENPEFIGKELENIEL